VKATQVICASDLETERTFPHWSLDLLQIYEKLVGNRYWHCFV